MGIVVKFLNQKRGPNNNVVGQVNLTWTEDIFGNDTTLLSITEDFDFPAGGEQVIYDVPFDVGVIGVTARVKVFEKAGANQVCVQGRLEAKALGIINVGHDLDENCHPLA